MATKIDTQEAWDELLTGQGKRFCLVSADWHPPSQQILNLISIYAKRHPLIQFFYINWDQQKAFLAQGLTKVSHLPTIFFFEDVILKAKLEECQPFKVTKLVGNWANGEAFPAEISIDKEVVDTHIGEDEPSEEQLMKQLEALTISEPVMLIMKGTKFSPFCRFSKEAVKLLNELEVDYGTFDVLSNEDFRAGFKTFSLWPTFPQLYIRGEFIGGIDIMKEMYQDGTLLELIPDECVHTQAQSDDFKLEESLNTIPIILFLDDTAKSSHIKKSLSSINLKFSSYSMSTYKNLKEKVEEKSGSKYFPQLFIGGVLFGDVRKLEEIISNSGLDGLKSEIEFYWDE